jgi:hypothetical protein
LQNEGQNNLSYVVKDIILSAVFSRKNTSRTWLYGYDEKHDIIVISKTGQIGQIINISGINIALPPTPDKCLQRSNAKAEQYWQRL